LTQLVGDRLYIANATGCTSIYGGNLPTTPYCKRDDGRGPCWANSLFEDNAEFGFGMRLAVDKFNEFALEMVDKILGGACGDAKIDKALVLDTEVYSNTGGQASKSTPMGAVAKFAAGGKPSMKKDLGMISMTYGNIYVATVALGANPAQCVKAFMEAEQYDGPAIIIAYSHCIAHGIDMTSGMQGQKDAVNSAHFPLYRHNPELTAQGKNPLALDSKPPTMSFSEHAMKENRFRVLKQMNPEHADKLMAIADKKVLAKFDMLQKLAAMAPCTGEVVTTEPKA